MYYLLRLNLSATLPADIRTLYEEAVLKHNTKIDKNTYYDAGFDLICPAAAEIDGFNTTKLDMGVRGEMICHLLGREFSIDSCSSQDSDFDGMPVGYFLYPRSSTGTKTPLRLANSIGIIDAGYRGNYIAAFDNIRPQAFTVEKGQRLVQICPPNLTYPLRVELVDDLDFASAMQTERGAGGFGSTGK
jgi:dUTP pyrophosphatase